MINLAASLFLVASALDWIAVGRRTKPLEYVTKPAAIALLLLVAASIDPLNPWFIAALAFSLVGDIFLMLPRDLFVPGLSSFLLAHLAYVAGFLGERDSTTALLVALAGMLIVGSILAVPIVRAAPRPLKGPVIAYAAAISTMAASAIATAEIAAIVGASLFISSDYLIARTRFLRPARWAPVAIMITYHLGQGGLVASLLV